MTKRGMLQRNYMDRKVSNNMNHVRLDAFQYELIKKQI